MPVNPVRVAFMLSDRSDAVFTSPKTRSPFSDGIPQLMQNAAPVIPIVPLKTYFGMIRGIGPLLFVSPGDVPEQFSFGPQPKFAALHDQVDLVVALGPVLRLPQALRLRDRT